MTDILYRLTEARHRLPSNASDSIADDIAAAEDYVVSLRTLLAEARAEVRRLQENREFLIGYGRGCKRKYLLLHEAWWAEKTRATAAEAARDKAMDIVEAAVKQEVEIIDRGHASSVSKYRDFGELYTAVRAYQQQDQSECPRN